MNASSAATVAGWLRVALDLPDGATPFPWQEQLLQRFRKGEIPCALDVPTGLGKTATMALWLVARAAGASVPRRLVYVVDRRAVVDQATDVAMQLRKLVDSDPTLKQALGLEQSLPISTLRGQFVDNREWLEDPSAPAIVIGTVDMIGSRLLFSGYGVSRKMRPYHAGLLGADALIVLDEAHLVPPFERLIEQIAAGDHQDRALCAASPYDSVVPPLRLMSLSATAREPRDKPREDRDVIRLTDADRAHPEVKKRLSGHKRLVLRAAVADKELPGKLADEAWQLSEKHHRQARIIVFCTSRVHAQTIQGALSARAGKPDEIAVELLVGGRRVYEREQAAKKLAELGFVAGDEPPVPAVARFVIATAAGEVGVDLDAEHAVCDLVAWERMVQRLGRINRRGKGSAEVMVVPVENDAKTDAAITKLKRASVTADDADDDGDGADDSAVGKAPKLKPDERRLAELALRRAASHELISKLRPDGDARDASLNGLLDLRQRAATTPALDTLLERATTPPPLHPPLARPLVEAWSMTSLEDHTGRPKVAPWIRGWPDEPDEPQMTVVWRDELPLTDDGKLFGVRDLEAFRDAADPHLAEQLETETRRVVDWLFARCQALELGDAVERGHDDDSDEPDADEPSALAATQIAESTSEVSSSSEPAEPSEPPATPAAHRPIRKTPAGHVIGVIIDRDDHVRVLLASEIADQDRRRALQRSLTGATLLVDASVGGLLNGLLAEECNDRARDVTAIGTADIKATGRVVPFRVSRAKIGLAPEVSSDWRTEASIRLSPPEDDDAEVLVIESLIAQLAESEEGRSVGHAQSLVEHQAWTAKVAKALASRLKLGDHARMLELAALLHDEGKQADRWQLAFNAPRGEPLAKTTSRPRLSVLAGYRHELGSLPYAERHAEIAAWPPEMRELCLHLIAAHHGYARPVIRTDGATEPPSSPRLRARVQQIALRFATLEQQWGPWGLAWWETLLRAADQRASRLNDRREDPSNAPSKHGKGGDRG